MNTDKKYLVLLFSILSLIARAQEKFSGWIVDHEDKPLIGAAVYWKDSILLGTVTDENGAFEIQRLDSVSGRFLIIRHVSYAPVEVEIFPQENHLRIRVEADAILETEVEIIGSKRDAFTSTLNPINIETLSSCELKRAACCSLAESFENNGTVNVSFSDAVTGAREIEMLGLRGIYTQMLIENRPTFNRLGRAYGLEYIPGSWIDVIQISKGASTVRNGVQGITGQINTELIKPNKADPFYINLYGSNIGRFELNTNLAHRFNKKWSTGLLLHGNYFQGHIDHNHDFFLDVPQKKQVNALWRLLHGSDLWHFEFNVQGILDNRYGGQTHVLFENHDTTHGRLYQISNDAKILEAFGKLGYLGFKNPGQSMALVWSATIHDQKGLYGDRIYNGLQKSIYANLTFQTPLKTKEHNLNSGLNYQLDDFTEHFSSLNLDRREHVVSLFSEYDFNRTINSDKGNSFGVILGMRADYVKTNNFERIIPSPRVNVKYNFNENLILRASGGRGMRLANILIENIRYMPGSRNFILDENILPEIAWNYGLNLTYNYKLAGLDGTLNVDAYRTDFENQYISDVDISSSEVHFYNLNGQSYSNSLLVAITQNVSKTIELRLAYKFNDVQATMNNELRWQTFSPRHRALFAFHATTPKKDWQFNFNVQFTGPQRLPFLSGDLSELPEYRKKELSKSFVILNAQVTRYFKNNFEFYIGGENLGNYTQKAPILGADNPFGGLVSSRPFDATAVYGPIMGFMAYVGIRYSFKGKEKKNLELKEHLHDNGEEISIKTSAQCGMCKSYIEDALIQQEGIYHAELNLKNKSLLVHYNSELISPETIRRIISEVGYHADDVKRNESVHDKLPECCKSK